MKMRYKSHISILFGLLAVLGSNLLVSTAMAALIVNGLGESFEAGTSNYSLTGEFGSGGVTDYFEVIPNNGTRVDSTIITTSGIFANDDGDSVLASDDSNAGGTNPVNLLLNSVATSGFTDLSFSLLLAASNPTQGGPTRGFELLDRVAILIDAGSGFTQLAIFQPAGGGTNTYSLMRDTANKRPFHDLPVENLRWKLSPTIIC